MTPRAGTQTSLKMAQPGLRGGRGVAMVMPHQDLPEPCALGFRRKLFMRKCLIRGYPSFVPKTTRFLLKTTQGCWGKLLAATKLGSKTLPPASFGLPHAPSAHRVEHQANWQRKDIKRGHISIFTGQAKRLNL